MKNSIVKKTDERKRKCMNETQQDEHKQHMNETKHIDDKQYNEINI